MLMQDYIPVDTVPQTFSRFEELVPLNLKCSKGDSRGNLVVDLSIARSSVFPISLLPCWSSSLLAEKGVAIGADCHM
jgi:hypothetical protein